MAWDFKRHSLRNALLITISADREKAAIRHLDECEVGGQTIFLQAIPVWMSCDDVLEWVGEEVLKEYKNLKRFCRTLGLLRNAPSNGHHSRYITLFSKGTYVVVSLNELPGVSLAGVMHFLK